MTKTILLACVALITVVSFAGDAEAKSKKTKTKSPVAVTQPVATPAPTPAPAPKSSFMDEQIAKALARTAPTGVTTYGAMAAAVAAGQNGGDPIAAAEAASAGW